MIALWLIARMGRLLRGFRLTTRWRIIGDEFFLRFIHIFLLSTRRLIGPIILFHKLNCRERSGRQSMPSQIAHFIMCRFYLQALGTDQHLNIQGQILAEGITIAPDRMRLTALAG